MFLFCMFVFVCLFLMFWWSCWCVSFSNILTFWKKNLVLHVSEHLRTNKACFGGFFGGGSCCCFCFVFWRLRCRTYVSDCILTTQRLSLRFFTLICDTNTRSLNAALNNYMYIKLCRFHFKLGLKMNILESRDAHCCL